MFKPQASVINFSYILQNDPSLQAVDVPPTPASPVGVTKVPGPPANPLSPTFQEEQML